MSHGPARAKGFDMRILAVDRRHDDAFAKEHGIEFVSLDEALAPRPTSACRASS
ncbi:MAG TPA: hypothetical protein VLJ57_13315 [Burkholderiaceae bacterium]|nr:hypothetical protein [Burkholderiaceae bacterium]